MLLQFHLKLRWSRGHGLGLLELLLELKELLVDLAAVTSLLGTSGWGGALHSRIRRLKRVRRDTKCLLLFLALLQQKSLVQLFQLVNVVALHHWLLLNKM